MKDFYPDVPKEEFENRYSKARKLMKEKDIDALFITERLNYEYFSGHRSEQNAVDKIRSYIFILPKDDEPTLITIPFEIAQVEQTTYFKKFFTTSALFGHPEFISNTLKKIGLGNAVIGAELGIEQYLGMSYLSFQEIEKNLSNAKFVDASDIILKLRLIKSSNEINYIRKAGQISAQAQKETFSLIHEGMTENEIAKILRTRLIEHGAEKLSLLCVVSGATPSTGIVLLPTDRVIQKGETVGFDVGVSYKGYWSDLARTASVGPPSGELDEFYSWMMHLRHECNLMLQPNKTPAEVIGVCDDIINKRNLKRMGVGRIGHGVGLATTEYPSIAAFQDIQFKQGMVFACNPNFANHLGFINAEDNWVITENKPDLLSDPVATNKILTIE